MLFSVDEEKDSPQQLEEQEFVELDILERSDFQEWALEEPALLGEDLLIITSEYANFEQTRDRLDILALDPNGKLVVVELKRDEADKTTDLQAIKYASYCATLTAEEIQQDYREFWNERGEKDLSPDDVGEEFADFLDESVEEGVPITDDGWADFDLDDKPRILLVAGEFGIEVTAPVMWLIEEYDLDITCVVVQAYEHNDEFLLSNQQAIPVAEAEEYMTRRREKQEKQQESQRRTRAIEVLLDRGVLATGDIVEFDEDAKPNESEWKHDPSESFWTAEVTGDTGRSDNVRWEYDDEVYSFSGLTKELIAELTEERPTAINGYKNWCHPEFGHRTLSDLRNSQVEADDRST